MHISINVFNDNHFFFTISPVCLKRILSSYFIHDCITKILLRAIATFRIFPAELVLHRKDPNICDCLKSNNQGIFFNWKKKPNKKPQHFNEICPVKTRLFNLQIFIVDTWNIYCKIYQQWSADAFNNILKMYRLKFNYMILNQNDSY